MFIQHLGCQMDSVGCFSYSLSKICEQRKKKAKWQGLENLQFAQKKRVYKVGVQKSLAVEEI